MIGSLDVWGKRLLVNEDARKLTNGSSLSFFVTMTCLNGYFQDVYSESLAEALLRAEHGGAVAVWASSGLTGLAGQTAAGNSGGRPTNRQASGRGTESSPLTATCQAPVVDRRPSDREEQARTFSPGIAR